METSHMRRHRRLPRPAVRARDGFGHRVLIALVALTLLGVLALAWGFAAQLQRGESQDQRLSAQGDAIRSLLSSSSALADQVRSLGAVPVVTPAEIAGPAGAVGPAGSPGADSTVPGPAGPTGADSTVPGPAGPAGQDGQDGQDGADGAPGATGPAGPAGPPPAGFTFVDNRGRTQTCTRDAGSPDDAATYTCTTSDTPAAMRMFFPT